MQVVIGVILAPPVAWGIHHLPSVESAIVNLFGILYTIRSLALFVLLPPLLHTQILDPIKELEHALARGAHIYAEIVGYGATSDGADMVAPSGEGAVRCMQMAMHGVDTPIDYLNSHGTSTPVGDVKELGAIREVFGDNSPAISATKAMTGHSLGAAGVQEAIYSLLMLEHGFIAPSINIEELDEQAAGLNIVTKPTEQALTTVMSNSFGFGGTNATLVMRKYNA